MLQMPYSFSSGEKLEISSISLDLFTYGLLCFSWRGLQPTYVYLFTFLSIFFTSHTLHKNVVNVLSRKKNGRHKKNNYEGKYGEKVE